MPEVNATVCADWTDEDGVEGCGGCGPDGTYDAVIIARMIPVASSLLYRWSGRQWPGVCSDYVRPCAKAAGTRNIPNYHGRSIVDAATSGWLDTGSLCSCQRSETRRCSCVGVSEIRLGGVPIVDITEVLVDGAALDPSEYEVVDDAWLARLPDLGDADLSPQSWPCCQRLDLDDTNDDTFAVSYDWGQDPPPDGAYAAAVLACELAKACAGQECNLPQRVSHMAREGVDLAILEPGDLRDSLPMAVRYFLDAANPKDVRRPPSVWSPDTSPTIRRSPQPGS